MSSSTKFSYSAVAVALLGVALRVGGGALAYLSFVAEWAAAQRLFTPLGVIVAVSGVIVLLSLLSKEV